MERAIIADHLGPNQVSLKKEEWIMGDEEKVNGNFMDFVVAASNKKSNLGAKLIDKQLNAKKTPEEIQEFFNDAGYKVSKTDCKKLRGIVDHLGKINYDGMHRSY